MILGLNAKVVRRLVGKHPSMCQRYEKQNRKGSASWGVHPKKRLAFDGHLRHPHQ